MDGVVYNLKVIFSCNVFVLTINYHVKLVLLIFYKTIRIKFFQSWQTTKCFISYSAMLCSILIRILYVWSHRIILIIESILKGCNTIFYCFILIFFHSIHKLSKVTHTLEWIIKFILAFHHEFFQHRLEISEIGSAM
jgi:hypothetical protein